MKRYFILILAIILGSSLWAQNEMEVSLSKEDSLLLLQLEELEDVVIIGKTSKQSPTQNKLASIDQYLDDDNRINMIRRGGYAWEPYLNGMNSERSTVTIDGMHIYGACTDKMDPITSYVETTNLDQIGIHGSQEGAEFGSGIAGSLNLNRQCSDFTNSGFGGRFFAGFSSNNFEKVVGTKLNYSSNRFFADADFTFRDADNYKAGKRREVLYSQFRKYNTSMNLGWAVAPKQRITFSGIYDLAQNVGYPALPMDVLKAEAVISSVEYEYHHLTKNIEHFEAKGYFNKVTHIMDDSHRPDVPIRMDMPGWSTTAGFYSLLRGKFGRHQWKLNLSGHFNYSIAEMTMYSNNPEEKDMFMLTWPGVQTFYTNLYLEDRIQLSSHWTTTLTLSNALHDNFIASEFGYQSLKIFYSDLEKNKARWLTNVGAKFEFKRNQWNVQMGANYAERAPSVSEGYGFYLFNSFDRYDYVGNPFMKKEKAMNFDFSTTFKMSKVKLTTRFNYFGIVDYIIGRPDESLSSMNIGIEGVKVYEQLPFANQINTDLSITYFITNYLHVVGDAIYRKGFARNENLPLIQPFSYDCSLVFHQKGWRAEIGLEGAIRQYDYSSSFGESETPAYLTMHLALSKELVFKNNHSLSVAAGVNNLLDAYYHTFADWSGIPRMGRNFYLNLIYQF